MRIVPEQKFEYRPIPPTSASWRDLDFNLPSSAQKTHSRQYAYSSSIYDTYTTQQSAYHTGPIKGLHFPVHGSTYIYVRPPGWKTGSLILTGTLAAVVINRTTRQQYLLSGNHVFFALADKPQAEYPATFDAAKYNIASNKIGGLVYEFADSGEKYPIGKTAIRPVPPPAVAADVPAATAVAQANADPKYPDFMDAALATVTPGVSTSFEVNDIGVVRGPIDAKLGMHVKMNGATSGIQTGYIAGVSSSTMVNPSVYRTTNRFVAKNFIQTDFHADHGDSGSLLVNDDNRVVGILSFGRLSSGTFQAFVSAVAIEKQLNIVFSEEELAPGYVPPASLGTRFEPKTEPQCQLEKPCKVGQHSVVTTGGIFCSCALDVPGVTKTVTQCKLERPCNPGQHSVVTTDATLCSCALGDEPPPPPPPKPIPAPNPFQSFIQWLLDLLAQLFGIFKINPATTIS